MSICEAVASFEEARLTSSIWTMQGMSFSDAMTSASVGVRGVPKMRNSVYRLPVIVDLDGLNRPSPLYIPNHKGSPSTTMGPSRLLNAGECFRVTRAERHTSREAHDQMPHMERRCCLREAARHPRRCRISPRLFPCPGAERPAGSVGEKGVTAAP
jgi:hypothetical protein